MTTPIELLLTGSVRVDVSLNWAGPGHYEADDDLPCRICGTDTPQRDGRGLAAHKTCVEQDVEAQVLAFAQSLLAAAPAPARRRSATVRAVSPRRSRRSLRAVVA